MPSDSSSSFEADPCYIGEDINTEISHKACRYRKSNKGVVLMPNSFLSKTQLLMINQLQDVSTRRSLSTAYRIRSEVRDGYLYTKR